MTLEMWKLFLRRLVKQWNKLSRGVVDGLTLETVKTRLDWVLSNRINLKMSLFRGIGLDDL